MNRAGVRANADKRRRIRNRAAELAMNQGKAANEASNDDVRRAERELLGLQTLPDPDDPLAKKPLA